MWPQKNMGIVNKLMTSVSGLYNSINPITLSGVNDVIVVEDSEGELKCTEFQLRFGRLYFYGVTNKTVHLLVNGKLCDITMSITSQGELFFEKYTENDPGTDYDELLEYNSKFLETLDSDNEIVLSQRLEQLSFGKDTGLYMLNLGVAIECKNQWMEDVEFKKRLRAERARNIKMRMYSYIPVKSLERDTYRVLTKKFEKFGNLISSADHFDFLIRRYRMMLHLINGLHRHPPFTDGVCNEKDRGCAGPNISFSSCYSKKIHSSLDRTFSSFLVQEITKPEELVVRIQGCQKCTAKFYLPYNIFCRIFFEIRGAKINKIRGMLRILESEYNRLLGWNIFRAKKMVKRDVSFSLRLNSAELKMLNLMEGRNHVVFKVSGMNKQLEGSIYLWKEDSRIIVSDIDGTITKSDVLGHIYGIVGRDWTQNGVASLYTKIVKNGYKIVYLTARPLGQSSSTKSYLKGVHQDGYKLPDGPVILSPDSVLTALYREIIIRRPEDFKIACLRTIREVFNGANPFVAGFGNKVTDVITYKALEIPLSRIFTINHRGELYAELVKALSGTYKTMNDFVDSIFPCLSSSTTLFIDHTFSDFSWWGIQSTQNV